MSKGHRSKVPKSVKRVKMPTKDESESNKSQMTFKKVEAKQRNPQKHVSRYPDDG
jgi:hypothetical protein